MNDWNSIMRAGDDEPVNCNRCETEMQFSGWDDDGEYYCQVFVCPHCGDTDKHRYERIDQY